MTSFRLRDTDKCDSVLFFDAILFLTWPLCSKGMWARLWYVFIKSCNSDAGFGANICSECSRNQLKLGENVESEKRAYETSSEEDSLLVSRGSATAIKRKKVPSQKFLPAYHEAYPCLVPSSLTLKKGSKPFFCTTCKLDFHGGWFDCKQPVESKSYKEFKATGKFFSSFKSVSFSLSLPFSLSLVLMQQTYSFSALTNSDSTSL